jgi:hypothetical protein
LGTELISVLVGSIAAVGEVRVLNVWVGGLVRDSLSSFSTCCHSCSPTKDSDKGNDCRLCKSKTENGESDESNQLFLYLLFIYILVKREEETSPLSMPKWWSCRDTTLGPTELHGWKGCWLRSK